MDRIADAEVRRLLPGTIKVDIIERKPLATTGVVRSFTIIHRAAPGVPVPYVSSVVELDGGGVVKANLLDAGTGTHSWGYWEDALLVSWPVLAHGLGLPA